MRLRHTSSLFITWSCALCFPAVTLHAQTTGFTPLDELASGHYRGFQGGFYPGGSNTPPPAHLADALDMASQIVPRDAAGNPDPDGWIVLVAIGMSNTAHEFGAFERNEDVSIDRNARVVLMDTALGGQAASIMANPDANYWTFVENRLTAMGLAPAQVQAAWMKPAEANPPDNFPIHVLELQQNMRSIVQILHARFANLKLCYLSGRTFGGYATIPLNPEPQAYESSFASKWLIEDQIAGDPGLSYGQLPGPVRAPLLLWGPYLWADGTNPRQDGLVWLPSDFEADGTHPSPGGEQKVAGLLSRFFRNEVTAAGWWPRQDDAVLVPVDASHDAHVDAGHPNQNFGNAPQLVVRGGDLPILTYLGLDVGDLGALAVRAKLSLRTLSGGGGNVLRVPDTGWSENVITFNGAPLPGALLVEMPNSSRDGTIAADVTFDAVNDPDGRVGFALRVLGPSQMTYHSKESGAPPRMVMTVPCSATPDSDGDGRTDICDCAPADPTLFDTPREIVNLRWPDGQTLRWDPDDVGSGSATRYDVMSGDMAEMASLTTNPGDQCLGDDLPSVTTLDPLPDPAPGAGRFYLVRGDNACGKGCWERASDGRDRLTTVCP